MKSTQDEINKHFSMRVRALKSALHTTRGKAHKSYDVLIRTKVGRKINHHSNAFATMRQAKAFVLNVATMEAIDHVEIREVAETMIECEVVQPTARLKAKYGG